MNHFSEGLHNLLSSRLRSLLALTGILIGTCSVVAMMLGGKLATDAALAQFQNLGTDLLDISIVSSTDKNSVHAKKLQPANLRQIIQINPAIQTLAPYTLSYPRLHHLGRRLQGSVLGVTPDFFPLLKISLQSGRFISPSDNRTFYCVIGDGIAEQIRQFSAENPQGHFIRSGNMIFKIVGILKKWPENIFLPVSPDNAILIPIQSAMMTDSSATLSHIIAKIKPKNNIATSAKWLEKILQAELPDRRIFVRSPEELINRIRHESDILDVFLGLTGGITLLVGGIGIMNIMLVSVLERRREIGVRLALGARNRDIRNLFLAEAIVLSLLGGIPGILLGLFAAWLFAFFWHWPFQCHPAPLLAGFTVATLTGILAGLYPAIQAARSDPVMALRAD